MTTLPTRRALRRLAALLAAAALAAPRLHAQTLPVDDPVLRRIWALGMDSSRVGALLQALSDSIGPRLTGTPQMRAANEWAVATYTKWGITARNEQVGTWRGWRRGTSNVDLLQPRARTLEATLLAWSAGTKGRDVTAPVVVLPQVADSNEFVRWLPQARGKFVLVSFPQPTCRPDENLQRWATDSSLARFRRQRIADTAAWNARVRATGYSLSLGTGSLGRRLEQAGVAGVIASRWSEGWGVNKVFFARTELVPSVDVSCEDYGLLFRLAANGQGPVLRVRSDAEITADVPTFNTVAEIRGSERPNEYVMLSAHFDSWDAGSGTTDNGTGTATMMEAMRILKAAYPRPKRTILVGHWASEEQGLNGSRAFSEDHPEIVRGLQALFNQDNGTGRVVNVSPAGLVNAGEAWGRWASRLPAEISQYLTFSFPGSPAGGGSDNASFACYGAPGFGLGSLSWDYGTYTWHTNRDTYDKLWLDDVKNNATLVAMLAYLASEDSQTVARDQRVMPRGQVWPACVKAVRRWSDFAR
ncbi:peptidase M28 [Gemmatirosa kalamazoonensis]|uniref:Carboxypeptidase Q n=1 Tax=Gemmatirosa kalamazoonensis TaxID=861299 RepID=W0RNA5_9BACT|nr:M20/M25/M40 family metallo-hydrolase [Gemmatirosa kalamazoonensis]AHG91800.1 peptidase M28 [Gemmatirosa kalamazoonensis]